VKPFKFITRRNIRHIDTRDFGARRADAKFANESVEAREGPGGESFDAPVGKVTHPPGKLKVTSCPEGEISVAYALHPTRD
jgi:hypothetical protein